MRPSIPMLAALPQPAAQAPPAGTGTEPAPKAQAQAGGDRGR
jgi:hypothetical protein